MTALQVLDPDMHILATWEGVYAGIYLENFEIMKVEARQTLVIDVEEHWSWCSDSG